ncbi:hypothetical protein [Streptomyces sp. E1N211]|uniref:hypothetical protein n=1 Tax=Streptomyces sp. E1N211 TaxID=1851876 RepID=UPI001F4EDEFC|nr:hypothetical protein [Streptomyces sp. E1N211]
MTFEGHTDRAPRLLPHREQGEALLAIQEAAPKSPSEAGLDLFAVPAGEVQGSWLRPLSLPPALSPACLADRGGLVD